MDRQRSSLRFGAPLRFRDRWQGRLAACELDADWAVRNVVLARGLLLRTSVRISFALARDWSEDALSLDCTSDDAFGRWVATEAVPTRRLGPDTVVAVAQAKLVGLLVGRQSRQASHLLIAHGSLRPEEHLVPVNAITLQEGGVRLAAQVETFPQYRPDADLTQAVRQAIAAHPKLSQDDRRGLAVEAVDGIVYLLGNVRTPQAKHWAQEAAAVPGALEVRNQVVDDISLEIAVGRALAEAGRFREARVFVRASGGQVVLNGFVPSQDMARDIEGVVSGLAGVRGVTLKLEVQAS